MQSIGHVSIDRRQIFVRHAMLIGVIVIQITEKKLQHVSDLNQSRCLRESSFASYIKDAFVSFIQFFGTGSTLLFVTFSRHPFSTDIEPIFVELLLSSAEDHIRRLNDIADRFGHFLIVLVDHETVNEDIGERCVRLNAGGEQQRG